MKTVKRAAALCLALLCCLIAFPASAAGVSTVSVALVTAKAGDTIRIPVNITRTENVASVEVHIGYDTAVLRCVSAQMSDTVQTISLSNVNTEPKGHPDEVWLTAVGTTGVVLDGELMVVEFEVLGSAKAGLSPVTVRKVTALDTNIKDIAVTFTDGGVTVEGDESDDPSQSTSGKTQTQTTATTVTATQTTVTGTTGQGDTNPTASTSLQENTTTVTVPQESEASKHTAVSPGGETVALPEQTVVDIGGSVVTDAGGEPSRVRAVAVMLGSATGKPGETVIVKVALSAVTDLSVLGIAVHYDVSALQFEGGECIGFIKDSAGMTSVVEHKSGVVDITATANAIGGSGEIAVLRFKVKPNAKNGEYRIAVKGNPLLQAGNIELPVKNVAGKIVVEGGRNGWSVWNWLLIGAIATAFVTATTVAVVAVCKKKGVPPKAVTPRDVSGEDN